MNYTEEERRRLIDYVIAFTKKALADFLAEHEIPVSGTKAQIREAIEEALANRSLRYADLVGFLDMVGPWGAQHVRLLSGPNEDISRWRDRRHLVERLRNTPFEARLDTKLNYILPHELKVTSIEHTEERLRVTTIGRRETVERDEQYDETRVNEENEEIELRAYVTRVYRAIVAFDWDLTANTGMIQVAQLGSKGDYGTIIAEFATLIQRVVDLRAFEETELRLAIKRFHELEDGLAPPVRSQAIAYKSLGGRRLEGRSYHGRGTLVGEREFDDAMRQVRTNGSGHLANLYWQPRDRTPVCDKPVHFHLYAQENRIIFPTGHSEEIIRHVVEGVRQHCI